MNNKVKGFQVSVELHTAIIAHNEWLRNNSRVAAENKTEEPHNPWAGIVEQIASDIKDVEFGWGSHEELVIFFLTDDLTSDPYEYVKSRYKLGALDTQNVLDKLEHYNVLRTEYSLC